VLQTSKYFWIKIINFSLLCLTVAIFIGGRGGRCGGGGQQEPPPQVSANLFCEWDQMSLSDNPYFSDIFAPELKKANQFRIVVYYADSTNLNTITTLDDRQNEVYYYLLDHRTIADTITGYDSKFYVCCVENLIDQSGNADIGGLSYWHSDTSIHGEGMSAIATQRISDLWVQQSPSPPDLPYLYIAWSTAHEIGHLFNIGHCGNAGCVMEKDLNVAGNAHKTFCSSCRTKLSTNLP